MPEGLAPPNCRVLGYSLARITLEEATAWCLAQVRQPSPKLLVTLNPEIVVRAAAEAELRAALLQADLTVADGVGILWAARQAGCRLPERVPGVDLATRLLERGGSDLRVFFLGARPGVAERAATNARARFGTTVAGTHHGYFRRPEDEPDVTRLVSASGAQLLLAGLGEGQELLLHRHRQALAVPLMIGVGGTLDVLAGEVSRTPDWTHRLGLEWAYRIGADPKRWHRFPRLLSFVRLVLRERR